MDQKVIFLELIKDRKEAKNSLHAVSISSLSKINKKMELN